MEDPFRQITTLVVQSDGTYAGFDVDMNLVALLTPEGATNLLVDNPDVNTIFPEKTTTLEGFIGHRFFDGVSVQRADGVKLTEDDNLEFNWGDNGSGSLALARSLLSATVGANAESYMSCFAGEVVSKWPSPGWRITKAEIRAWVMRNIPF